MSRVPATESKGKRQQGQQVAVDRDDPIPEVVRRRHDADHLAESNHYGECGGMVGP
jgi:hypothetical protein